MTNRSVARTFTPIRTLEGGGFEVRRAFPSRELDHLDPFLLLDEMGPSQHGPGEAKGAPDHPHRGFETVTYLLSGAMEHRDSAGNHGRLGPGDVQWMTAGSGVVHSELPSADFLRTGGRMHGFQLWVNLPAKDKMIRPRYQDIPAARLPTVESDDGKVRATIIAGELLGQQAVIDTRTPILYYHLRAGEGGRLEVPVPRDWNAFLYDLAGDTRVYAHDGDTVEIAGPGGGSPGSAGRGAGGPLTEALLIAGAPLGEPVARYGPFVMNTKAQILQAIEDFQAGRF
jgi:redox-sensitive bicupin YhaK (pirin superfamily)